jgi:hypothetical protein
MISNIILSPELQAKRDQKNDLEQMLKEATDRRVQERLRKMLRELEAKIICPN